MLAFSPLGRPTAAEALQHAWLQPQHTPADLRTDLPPCPFPFEGRELNLDHFLVASLDAVRAADPAYAPTAPSTPPRTRTPARPLRCRSA